MKKVKVQFGGGETPPKLQDHINLEKKEKKESTDPKVQFGSGAIPPRIWNHLGKSNQA